MAEEGGTTKVNLHKQEPTGLVKKAEQSDSLPEKQEDPEELTSTDFQHAADQAQVQCRF